MFALGGPAAEAVLGPHPRQDQRYFLRVWAARALLYAWDDRAARPRCDGARRRASWRVREMAAKVVAKRQLGDALPAAAALRDGRGAAGAGGRGPGDGDPDRGRSLTR